MDDKTCDAAWICRLAAWTCVGSTRQASACAITRGTPVRRRFARPLPPIGRIWASRSQAS